MVGSLDTSQFDLEFTNMLPVVSPDVRDAYFGSLDRAFVGFTFIDDSANVLMGGAGGGAGGASGGGASGGATGAASGGAGAGGAGANKPLQAQAPQSLLLQNYQQPSSSLPPQQQQQQQQQQQVISHNIPFL